MTRARTDLFPVRSGVLAGLVAALPFVAPASDAPFLAEAAIRLLEQVSPEASAAAAQIPDTGRRLLAARAYLRAGDALGERWSWTKAEAAAFEGSPRGEALRQEIAAVQCRFALSNPGLTLFVNPEFRTLEIQLQRWNQNESVGRAAEHLLDQLQREAAVVRGVAGDVRLRSWLVNHAPQPVPTLAAPGLSPHGRGTAIDFQVHRGSRVVAGPDARSVESVWNQGGWKARLAAAVSDSGAAFEGPLASPDEPWHYRYVADRPARQALTACTPSGSE